jgi:hypothetical protein
MIKFEFLTSRVNNFYSMKGFMLNNNVLYFIWVVLYLLILWTSGIPFIVLKMCPGQSLKSKMNKGAITPKLWKEEILFLCTALLLCETYLSAKLQVDTFNISQLKSWTKFKV